MDASLVGACLACGKSELLPILDLGPQPAANLLSDQPGDFVRKEKLALMYCDACGHAQQAVCYPPSELFGHYLYQSGTSNTLKQYFAWLAQAWSNALDPGSRVLELASNDGSFLKALTACGIDAEGVEPAHNLVEMSRSAGLKVTEGFWPGAKIGGRVDGVIAMNVTAHTPDPLSFLAEIRATLSDAGVALIQVSQVDMFRNFEFDTLYHEHYSFFSPCSLATLAHRAGFSETRFLRVDIHGGSLLAVLGSNPTTVANTAAALARPSFYLGPLPSEDRPTLAKAEAFGEHALRICATVKSLGALAREASREVVLVGAAAKAITVLQASGLVVDRVVDEAPLKIGRYLPGSDRQIEVFESIGKIAKPCLFIIGAWNFQMELKVKLRAHRAGGDLVAVYFPSVSMEPL